MLLVNVVQENAFVKDFSTDLLATRMLDFLDPGLELDNCLKQQCKIVKTGPNPGLKQLF